LGRRSIAIFLFISLALSVIPAIQSNYTEPIFATAQTVDTELSTEQKRLINQTALRIINANPSFVGNASTTTTTTTTSPAAAKPEMITALAQVIERIVTQTSNPDQLITHLAIETAANPTGPLSQALLLFAKQLAADDTAGVNQLASLITRLIESSNVNTTIQEDTTGNISQLIMQQAFQSALGANQLLNQIANKLAENSSKLSVNNVTISADAIAQTIQQVIIQVSLQPQDVLSFQPLLFIANQVNQNPLGPLSKSIVQLAQLQTTGGVGASQSITQSISELVKEIISSATGNVSTESIDGVTTTEQTGEDEVQDRRTKIIIRDESDEPPIFQPPPEQPPQQFQDNQNLFPITNETILLPPPPPPPTNATAPEDVVSPISTNQTAQLKIITEVINDGSGSQVAGNFSIFILNENTTFRVAGPVPAAPAPDGTTIDLAPGTYKVLELPLFEYGITFEGDCDTTGKVTLVADGPPKTCTVKLNDRIPGTIKVVTDVINDNGGNITDFRFNIVTPEFPTITISGQPPPDGITFPILFDRTFTIHQDAISGYATSFEGDCNNVAVVENQTKTCNIVNNDVAEAQLTVIKEVINDSGGTKTDDDVFVRIFNSRGDSIGSSALSPAAPARNVRVYDLALGTYDLDGLGGFDYLASFEGDCDSTGKVTLGADEPSKSCTVKFEDSLPGAVKVVTDVINDNGGNKTARDFLFNIIRSGFMTVTGRGSPPPDGVTVMTPSGSYTISQDAVVGYTTTIEGDCTNIVVVENQTNNCTIINDDVAGAELRVITQVINDNGGNRTAEDFRLFIVDANETYTPGLIPSVPPPHGIILDKRPGTYVIKGSSLGNYATSFDGDCDSSGRVTLALAEPKSCTIKVNDVEGIQLKVIAQVINDNGGNKTAEDFNIRIFNADATTSANAIRTGLAEGPVQAAPAPDGTVFDLAPGMYIVAGSPLVNYGTTFEGDCDNRARVTLAVDESPKVCTIKFQDRLPGLVKAKVVTDVINDNGGNKTARDFRFDIATLGFMFVGVSGDPPPDGRTFNMPQFLYTIDPRADPGYTTSLEGDCTDVLVVENQTKTCTITLDDKASSAQIFSAGNATLQNLTSLSPTTYEQETICDDGIDNDNDVKVDAADEDCLLNTSTTTPEENATTTLPSSETVQAPSQAQELQPAEDNNPPNADAGEDSSVESGETVELNGEGSNDPDANQELSYLWEQVSPGSPSVSLDGEEEEIASFKAPEVDEDTKFKFELTVKDGKGGEDTDSVTVGVLGIVDTQEEENAEEEQEEQEQEQDQQEAESQPEQLQQE
jgi:hypothetical protein